MPKANVKSFFEKETSTCQHVLSCPETKKCAIIDPVLDFALNSGKTATGSADQLVAYVRENGLEPVFILETHAHADHLTAAPYFKKLFPGATVGIGAGITHVQEVFGRIFNLGSNFRNDGSQFGRLFKDGETFAVGNLRVEVLHTPGHTPACVCYHVANDCVFTGDTIFMPDQGTARCDFPGGNPVTLWNSIQRILSLPPDTRVFTCHDYQPGGRAPAWESTIAQELEANIHVKNGTKQDEFISWRTKRDATLDAPKLIIPSIQVNIRAGLFPAPESNGVVYLKTPMNALTGVTPAASMGVISE